MSGDARPRLPGSLDTNRRLSQWLRLEPDRTVTVMTGKVELGQGIHTALAIIAAEELDLPPARIRIAAASTAHGPDEGVTSGSLSVHDSGAAVRAACSELRALALRRAQERHGAQPPLDVREGRIVDAAGHAIGDYWSVLANADLDVEASGAAAPKAADRLTLVGRGGVDRIDLPDKVFGAPRFVHDLRLPDMVHGRVLRPPSPSARLQSLTQDAVRGMPGVLDVVVDGRFVAVIARSEHEAQRALDHLRTAAAWSEQETLPDAQDLARFLIEAPATTTVVHQAGTMDAMPPDATLHEAEYLKPYLAHASIGPSCAVARWHEGRLEVWTHSQGIQNLRNDIVLALAGDQQPVARDAITVHHVEGAGCYGHNGADDVAFDAVLLALRMPGKPVRVPWSRADELAWSPVGPAQRVRLQAVVGRDKRVLQWRHALWANGAASRPGRAKTPALLAATHRSGGPPPLLSSNGSLATGGGSDRNSVPAYDIPNREVVNHRLDVMPIRTSSLRSLGAYANVFAAESFMDEIAHALGENPVAFRRRHLSDPRGLAVLDRLLSASRWWSTPREARAPHVGHGLAIARYKSFAGWCAVAARVEAAEVLRVQELDIAVDVGRVVHPDGVANQVEGGALQAVSWTLKEQVAFDRTRITSDSWSAYPILRFTEVPAVNVFIVDRPDCDSEGAGELAQGPVAAAIANALHDALGVRVRRLPLTPETIAQAMS